VGARASEALRPSAGHLRRVLPARLDVPAAPRAVPPHALPCRRLVAVGGLELAGLDHPEASARLRAEGGDEVAGLGRPGHTSEVKTGLSHQDASAPGPGVILAAS